MKKVLFKPKMDFFEVMEIQGLYDIFKDVDDLQVRAMSNGIISRYTNIKLSRGVAEVLNLVVRVEMGKIVDLYWSNACVDDICEFENCQETKFDLGDTTESEKNCYIQSCKSSKDTSNCDTKVFVTWVGNDRENRFLESDNNRITNFL